jgi:hypothetical protein
MRLVSFILPYIVWCFNYSTKKSKQWPNRSAVFKPTLTTKISSLFNKAYHEILYWFYFQAHLLLIFRSNPVTNFSGWSINILYDIPKILAVNFPCRISFLHCKLNILQCNLDVLYCEHDQGAGCYFAYIKILLINPNFKINTDTDPRMMMWYSCGALCGFITYQQYLAGVNIVCLSRWENAAGDWRQYCRKTAKSSTNCYALSMSLMRY